MTFTYSAYPEVDPLCAPSDRWAQCGVKEWRKNTPFSATLRLDSFQRGRSAAHFILKDDAGHEYTIFAKFLLEALQGDTCYSGWLHGKWAFAKRGANYSIIKL